MALTEEIIVHLDRIHPGLGFTARRNGELQFWLAKHYPHPEAPLVQLKLEMTSNGATADMNYEDAVRLEKWLAENGITSGAVLSSMLEASSIGIGDLGLRPA